MTATDIIRRGFDSAVANWPLLLIKIVESILLVILAIGSVIAILIPIFVSLGLSKFDLGGIEDPLAFLTRLLADYWMILLYVVGLVTLLLIIFVAIHSFVEAGVARVFADAERAAGPQQVARERLRFFSVERWLGGGRDAWWRLFLIYNGAWGLAGVIMLLPLLVLLALIVVFRDSPPAIVAACAGLAVTVFLILAVSVVTSIWTKKAIAVCVLRDYGAGEALSTAWREAFADFGRHFVVAFVMLVIMVGGSSVISTASIGFSLPGSDPAVTLAFTPFRMLLSIVSSIFSAAVGNWWMASFVALSHEARKR